MTTKHNLPLTYAEIDTKALKYNVTQIKKVANKLKFELPTRPKKFKGQILPMEIMAVIKANAYGHGVEHVLKILSDEKVPFYGVSDVTEGIELRLFGVKQPILLFESTMPLDVKNIIRYQLMPTICTLDLAKELNTESAKQNKQIDIHIQVDTGMGRLGVWYKEAERFIKEVFKLKNLRVMGVFTHFPAADTDRTFTNDQIKKLYELVINLDKQGLIIPYIHAANSMGLGGYKTHVLNLSRPGLMIYGLYPHKSLASKIKLKPVMSIKTKIIYVKKVEKNRSISYGRTFFTKKNMVIATIPIGYNDGYMRILSNKSAVLVKGMRCPVVGQITMDQTMIDVTHVPGVKAGDQVIVLGKQKDQVVSADELAQHAQTINYEIVCSMGNRLPHVYK